MIRKKKMFVRPRKAFELSRIKEENELLKSYGLKSKREVWKTLAKVKYYRGRAKALAKASLEEQEVLFRKLRALGLRANTIAEVLDLKIEDIFQRRLPTIVYKKKLANTPQHARQMVVHKKVLINGKVVNTPSYLVTLEEENKITLKSPAKKVVSKPVAETSGESE